MSNMTQAQIFAEQKRVDKERKRDRSGLRALDDERATGRAGSTSGICTRGCGVWGRASSITVDVGGREVAPSNCRRAVTQPAMLRVRIRGAVGAGAIEGVTRL